MKSGQRSGPIVSSHHTPPRSTIRINSTKCGQHAPNQSTTNGSIRAGEHDGEKEKWEQESPRAIAKNNNKASLYQTARKKHAGPRLMQAQVRRQQQINNLLSVTSVMDTIHRNNSLPSGRWLALSIRRCDGILGGGICGSCLSGTTVLSSTTTL